MAQKAKYGTEGLVQNTISCSISTKLMEPMKKWSLKDIHLLVLKILLKTSEYFT